MSPIETQPSGGGGGVGRTDGWVDDSGEAWTFASFAAGPPAVGTFTVSGDVTAKYTIGTRIQLTQTTVKFFVVTAVPVFAAGSTTVTISGGTDFTLANAAISANFHSYDVNPQGYPTWFAFAAAFTGFSSFSSTSTVFGMLGRFVMCNVFASGTSNATTFGWTAPVTCVTTSSFPAQILDNGAGTVGPGLCQVTFGSTTGNFYKDWQSTGWTNIGNKQGNANTFYRA
jgi:hypothetical protein